MQLVHYVDCETVNLLTLISHNNVDSNVTEIPNTYLIAFSFGDLMFTIFLVPLPPHVGLKVLYTSASLLGVIAVIKSHSMAIQAYTIGIHHFGPNLLFNLLIQEFSHRCWYALSYKHTVNIITMSSFFHDLHKYVSSVSSG